MAARMSLEELKREYIGKLYGYLTIEDVYRDDDHCKWMFRCKCVCGNQINLQLNKVTSGRAKSCGCYKKSKEFANKRRDWCTKNADKIRVDRSAYLDKLKSENIGKVYNSIEIVDISLAFNENGRIIYTLAHCRCKCGTIFTTRLAYVKSGHTKSCGCYSHSEEHSAALSKLWMANPDKVKERSNKHSKWYKNNPDKAIEQGKRHSQWYKDNPDKVKEKSKKYKQWCKDNIDKLIEQGKAHSQYFKDNPDILRISANKISQWYKDRRGGNDLTKLVEVTHYSCIDSLLNGDIKCTDSIKTKCPICGNYDEHLLSSVWSYTKNDFSHDTLPMCRSCRCLFVISRYEQEIANIISTFYNGECIRNNRTILTGKELDLYYPEKKIAIEFNGDYWHSDEFKDSNYHYNKYKQCKDLGITLVSIFEYDWNSRKEIIINYLKDLFTDKINNLSFNESHTYMNNNYPSPLLDVDDIVELNHYTLKNNAKVYTCGFSKLIRS